MSHKNPFDEYDELNQNKEDQNNENDSEKPTDEQNPAQENETETSPADTDSNPYENLEQNEPQPEIPGSDLLSPDKSNPNFRKCPNCGALYDITKAPLYCTTCGHLLVENTKPSVPREMNNSNTRTFSCPRCHFKSNYDSNPIFCMNCGYRFPRDLTGKLLIDNDGYAYMPVNQTNIPLSQKMPFYTGSSPQEVLPNPYYNPYYKPFKPATWSVGAGIGVPLLVILLESLVIIILEFILAISGVSTNQTGFIQFILYSAELLFLFIPVLWIQHYYSHHLSFKERLQELGFNFKKYTRTEKIREIIIGILFGFVGIALVIGLYNLSALIVQSYYGINISFITGSNSTFQNQFGQSVPQNGVDLLLIALGMALFVGFSEETMFRGFVQRSFETKLKKPGAILLTAIYFTLFHIFAYINDPPIFFLVLIPYLGISLLLGFMRWWRDDLLACAILHIVYDAMQVVLIFLILTPLI